MRIPYITYEIKALPSNIRFQDISTFQPQYYNNYIIFPSNIRTIYYRMKPWLVLSSFIQSWQMVVFMKPAIVTQKFMFQL